MSVFSRASWAKGAYASSHVKEADGRRIERCRSVRFSKTSCQWLGRDRYFPEAWERSKRLAEGASMGTLYLL